MSAVIGAVQEPGPQEPPPRSFSTPPRQRPRPGSPELQLAERCAAELTRRLADVLESEGSRVALLARPGADLSIHRFERECPRYTHLAWALRERDGWRVHHLLNTHEGAFGHLYRQPLVDFFRDDPDEYRTALLVPSLGLQGRLERVLRGGLGARIYTSRYSCISYPFSTRYMSSNQWVCEILGAAQSGREQRASIQAFLRASGFAPSVLLGVSPLRQWVGPWLRANTRVDDHPVAERLRGRLAFAMEPSLRAYLLRADAVRHVQTLALAAGA